MNSHLKSLQLIFRALLTGQVLFLAVAFFLKYQQLFPDIMKEQDKLLQLASLLCGSVLIWTGFTIFKKKMSQAKKADQSFNEKIILYRSASLVQWAMTEAASLFSIVCFLLTGNYAFTGLTVLFLFIFSGHYPVKIKIVNQLELSSEEADQL